MRKGGDGSIGEPLGVGNGLVEPNPEAHVPKRLYIARTLVQDQREVPVRVLNATLHDQRLAKGFPVARCEPVALVTQPDAAAPQDQETSQNLQDMIVAARPNLRDEEIRELEELITEYKDVFATQSSDYGRTDSVPPYRHRRCPADPTAPEEAPSSKTGRSK
jgi:hypothetical protein